MVAKSNIFCFSEETCSDSVPAVLSFQRLDGPGHLTKTKPSRNKRVSDGTELTASDEN